MKSVRGGGGVPRQATVKENETIVYLRNCDCELLICQPRTNYALDGGQNVPPTLWMDA